MLGETFQESPVLVEQVLMGTGKKGVELVGLPRTTQSFPCIGYGRSESPDKVRERSGSPGKDREGEAQRVKGVHHFVQAQRSYSVMVDFNLN